MEDLTRMSVVMTSGVVFPARRWSSLEFDVQGTAAVASISAGLMALLSELKGFEGTLGETD